MSDKVLNTAKKLAFLFMPVALQRLIMRSGFYKSRFKYEGESGVFAKIYADKYWETGESRSGGGSDMTATATIRERLPLLWKQYDVKTFLDVPCGDYNWMKEVPKNGVTYIGGDIVGELIEINNAQFAQAGVSFKVIDIANDELPAADMIFCKDCLQHLSYENIFKALANFKKSGSKYLLTTSYPKTLLNWDIADGDYRPLNLLKKPFCLPPPLLKIREKPVRRNIESDKFMYLYDLANTNPIP